MLITQDAEGPVFRRPEEIASIWRRQLRAYPYEISQAPAARLQADFATPDEGGWSLGNSMVKHLQKWGIQASAPEFVFWPSHFSAEELEMSAYRAICAIRLRPRGCVNGWPRWAD